MRGLYIRTPISQAEQRQFDEEMALLGIKANTISEELFEFWDEHQVAVTWWLQVQDLMRYSYGPGIAICNGLDVLAVKADSELSGTAYSKQDYQKLRLIAHTVTTIFNDKVG
ncbi:hypothetical protein Sps_03445 [Shewanella psychrophila]|uniref:Uncharacterized protein n=1 Tax=Shewanella psychrophila TaxID=225848 RepID=A0A1S6HSU5_9GAMM|nr:hypothetical protein [Shewanella psychrophila]AQS38572.1 hypothetical protein Sps_03445 [Shewanella psychrophila]